MRISYQALLGLALGLVAAGATLSLPLPGGAPADHAVNRVIEIDDLRLALSIGALVFGVTAVIVVASSFVRTLRRLGRRIREPGAARSDSAILKSNWYAPTVGSLIENIAMDAGNIDHRSTINTETELRRLFWHRIGRLQVWTATSLLFAVGAFSLIYRHLGSNPDGPPIIPVLAPAGILVILAGVALARLIVGGAIRRFMGIRRFMDDLARASLPETENILPLTLEMRVEGSNNIYRSPSFELSRFPPEPQPVTGGSAPNPGGGFGSSARAELDDALTKVLSFIERLEAQQRAASQDMAALRELIRAYGDQPPSTSSPIVEIDERMATLQSRLAELVAEMHATQKRVDQDLSAFAREVRDSRQYHQQMIGELTSSFNRLEARLVPILRHVATTNRSMALLSQQTGRLETLINKFGGDLEQERTSTTSTVTPLRPALGEARLAERVEMTMELRQLLTELEDAAQTDSSGKAQAAP